MSLGMVESDYFDLSTNVKKKIIKTGKYGRKPAIGWVCNIVLCHEGQDNSENLEIVLGNGCSRKDRLIELCVESMHLDEESYFIVKLEKENTVLKVSIVLKEFKVRPYIFQWTEEEKLEASYWYKTKGVELYKNNNIEEAFYKFSTALKFTLLLDSVLEIDEPSETILNLRTTLLNNLAGCHLHFKNYSVTVKLCRDSIALQPTSKAYYRKAIANIELKEYEEAEVDLLQVLKMEPKNKVVLEKYKLVRELDKPNRKNYESIVKKMFS